jgi:hypothetical protein
MAAGLDSLGSVELRNTLESSLALPLPPTLVMDYPTAAAIAAYAAAKLPAVVESENLSDDGVMSEREFGTSGFWEASPGPAIASGGSTLPVLAVTAFSTRWVE